MLIPLPASELSIVSLRLQNNQQNVRYSTSPLKTFLRLLPVCVLIVGYAAYYQRQLLPELGVVLDNGASAKKVTFTVGAEVTVERIVLKPGPEEPALAAITDQVVEREATGVTEPAHNSKPPLLSTS